MQQPGSNLLFLPVNFPYRDEEEAASVFGQSVNDFTRCLRLRRAAELFVQTNGNVNEAIFQVGIADTKYFRKQFSALLGMNPSDRIKKYQPAFSKDFTVNKNLQTRANNTRCFPG